MRHTDGHARDVFAHLRGPLEPAAAFAIWAICAMLVALGSAGPARAQTYRDAAHAPDGVISLPHELTPEELLILDEIGAGHRTTPPPTSQPVRGAAEFDRMQGVLIRYPLGISTAIVREMAEDVTVYCIVTASQQQQAYNTFQAAGVNMSHVVFFNANSDSYWTRDYGPWFIYENDHDCGIIDTIYNRPRPNDDAIPTLFANFLGIPAYGPDLIHTGGNWMSDGHGIASSTTLVWEENPTKTPAQINQIVHDYKGIHTYHVVPDPNNTYIDHIDCWGKFLAVDKVLIRSVPISHPQYDEIEETAAYYAAQVSSYGWPFQVYRVYTPNNEPYTNSLILNNKVLVPIMGGSWDSAALASYQAALPGYEVLGFTGSWESTDALHCRAKGVADLELLYVYSIPLRDTPVTTQPYRVAAEIIDHSETGLIANQLRVYWRPGTSGAFSSQVMTSIAGSDSFYTYIPAQSLGTTVQYYVQAADNSGRVETYPLVGAAGPFTFHVEPDNTPPVITGTTDLRSTDDTVGPYVVQTTVTDNTSISQVELLYRLNGGPFTALPMARGGRGLYAAGIPGQPHQTVVEYYVRATDIASNQTVDPPGAPAMLYVFMVAPEVNILLATMESGSSWTHGPVTGGFSDQWHLSTQRNHTPGGAQSWKCGATGAGSYAARLDAGLVTESFELGIDTELTYWQWIAAETSGSYPGYAYDGGLVEINAGGGWQQITPAGGYPYRIRNTSGTGPFPTETRVFSGSQTWHQVTFDLGAYEGATAQVRFRFGSDSTTGLEGWYVDDVSVDGFFINWTSVAEGEPATRVILAAAGASLARGAATLTFTLGAEAAASLQLFDAQGRLVRTLLDRPLAPGAYAVDWDHTTSAGLRAGPGVYFYRLQAGAETVTRRIVLF